MSGGGDRIERARAFFAAWLAGDRFTVEAALSDAFTFSSPADVGLDRDRYFERCWPNDGRIRSFHFERLAEVGDEVVVTYEAEKADGSRFRNTEVLAFDGDRLRSVEVYFGWSLAPVAGG